MKSPELLPLLLFATASSHAAVVFSSAPTGTANAVYTNGNFVTDTNFNATLISGASAQLINSDSAGATDQMTIAADGTGLTQLGGSGADYWENNNVLTNFSPRNAFRWDLGVGATNFTLGKMQVVVSGVADDGIQLRAAYKLANDTVVFKDIVGVAAAGVYDIDFTSDSLTFANGTSPLAAGVNFRIGFFDPASGNNTSGTAVIESVTLNTIPEPSSIALLSLAGTGLFLRRRR